MKKFAVLFNYYIGASTFGGVVAYIDDRETAEKFASDIEATPCMNRTFATCLV